MTQLIPAVAVHDLRLMWKIRQEFPRQSVDLHIVRPLATEGADLLAASLRVDFLRLLILQDSDAFGDLVNKGQPTDRLTDCLRFLQKLRSNQEVGLAYEISWKNK